MHATPDVSLAPELMMSNLEILSKLKYKDLILCEEKTGKITLDTRKLFTSLRPSGFNINILDKTLQSSLSHVTKCPVSKEAIRIHIQWPKIIESIENLRDTLFKYQYDADGINLRKLIAKVNLLSKNIIDEKSLTAIAAKEKKSDYEAPIPQAPPPPPEFKKAALKINDVDSPSKTPSFKRMAITEDLLKGVILKKTQPSEKKFKSSDDPMVEAFRSLLKRNSALIEESHQKVKFIDFDENGYWGDED